MQTDSATIDRAEYTTEHSPLVTYPSVWLHGAGMSASTFRHVIKGLPKAVALDLPGHGSVAAVQPPRVEGYAD